MHRLLQSPDSRSAAEAFNRFGDDYHFWMRHHPSPLSLGGLANLVSENSLVLDVGCGDGSLTMELARVARRVVGLDLSPRLISLARHRLAKTTRTNVDFVIGDIQALGFAHGSFDLIVSSFALHHTDQQVTLPAVMQLIRPGGWLYLQEPVCPVSGYWKRHLWFRWLGLQMAWDSARRHGIPTTRRVTRFLQSKAWIQHQMADNLWTPSMAQNRYPSLLPGCVIRQKSAPPSVTVLWRQSAATPPTTSLVRRQARQRDPRFPDPARKMTPIRVARHYPGPAPAGYVPFPRTALDGSVVTRFEGQVTLHEQKIALRTATKELTYGALNAAANRIARRVSAVSESASPIVAVVMDQDDDPLLPAILGVLKAGSAYLVIDPADPPEKQDRCLAQTGIVVAITTATEVKKLAGLAHAPRHLLVAEEIEGDPVADNLGLKLGPKNPAALFLTSGSTGEPKYVARDHLQFLHSTWLNTNTYYVSPEDRQSLLYFPGFTASVPNIYDTLLNGATLCTRNPRRFPLSDLVAWLHRERITHFNPSVGLWRSLPDVVAPDTQWPYLRLITLAGQPLYGKDIRMFQSRFGENTVLLHVLAMTETGVITQGYIDHTSTADDAMVPVGYPVADKKVVILGDDKMPLAVGEVGQIAVTSAYLSIGYWGDEAQTRLRYEPLPENLDGRTFLTGDRGWLRSDGCLAYSGRNDSIVKVRGYRINLASVETALNSHPALKISAVIVRTQTGGEQSLVAYIVPASGTDIHIPELRRFLSDALAHYMIPERFVQITAMPLTASGKIDRTRLPSPILARPELHSPLMAPRNELEKKIAEIWAALLEQEDVGITDNFFELGGDSITALRMLLRVEEQIGRVDAAAFFNRPTVAGMADTIACTPEQGQNRDQPSRVGGDLEQFAKKRRAWRDDTRRRLKSLISRGPVWGKYVMPYGIGVSLQRAWLQQHVIRNRGFGKQSRIFRRCLSDAGLADFQHRYLTVNLMANTWVSWRMQVLQSPSGFSQWVTLRGAELLQNSLNRGHGLIVVFVHQQFSIAATKQLLLNHAITESCVVTGASPGSEISSPEIRRTQNAHHAVDLLRRGGCVFIAGEGRGTTTPMQIPFYGRQLPLPRGFAELALHSKATIAAVFSDMSIDGCVTLEFIELQTPTTQIEADALVRHYGMMLIERWPKLLPTVMWGRLKYIQSLPAAIEDRG